MLFGCASRETNIRFIDVNAKYLEIVIYKYKIEHVSIYYLHEELQVAKLYTTYLQMTL